MQPILFTNNFVTISTFGLFLVFSVLSVLFIIWRIAKIYDLNIEKAVDLILITLFASLVASRLVFVLINFRFFDSLEKVFLINNYPGLSIWGALLGGGLALRLLAKRFKVNFWQIVDFAVVGLVLGMVIGNLGCFFSGSCGFGKVSTLPVAMSTVGALGKRIPVHLIESLLLLFLFFKLWNQTIKFHFNGKIVANFLVWFGVIRLITETLKSAEWSQLIFGFRLSVLASVTIIAIGLVIFYKRSKRKLPEDLATIRKFFASSKKRTELLLLIEKSWYNQKVNWQFKFTRAFKTLANLPSNGGTQVKKFVSELKRKINVKSTPTNIR